MKNKTVYAVVTGASSGIGLEFARLFAADGINLVIVARSKAELNQVAKDIKNTYPVDIRVLAIDLSQQSGAEVLFDYTQKEQLKIGYLINNAGFGDYGDFVASSWQKTYDMINLNITSLTYLSRVYAQQFVAQKSGHIVNLASTAAFQPGPYMSVYFATKSYVLHFSEAIATELNGTGVFVTALCPGPTKSKFQEAASLESSKLFKSSKLPTAAQVASFGYKAMKQGRVVAVYGFKNNVNTIAIRFLPRSAVRLIVKRAQMKG